MEDQNYTNKMEIVVRIVHVACALRGRVQEKLLTNEVMSKDDDSFVIVVGI